MEINSFNQLFAEAERAGLMLHALVQLQSGVFHCSWNRGDTFYPSAEHVRPFDAARDSLMLARGVEPAADLFDAAAANNLDGLTVDASDLFE